MIARAARGSPQLNLLALLAAAALTLVTCTGGGSPAPNPYAPRGTSTPAAGIPSSPIEGVVTGVRTEGLDQVHGFTLRTADGASWEFEIVGLQNATEFPPAHLVEHKATADAIRVWFHAEGSALIADRIVDG